MRIKLDPDEIYLLTHAQRARLDAALEEKRNAPTTVYGVKWDDEMYIVIPDVPPDGYAAAVIAVEKAGFEFCPNPPEDLAYFECVEGGET